MRRLLCIFCPPLAVLSCGFDLAGAIVNCFLMIFFYVPAVAHAWRTVTTYEEDQRTKQITSEIRALQEPLLLQVHSNLLAANAMMSTPTPRRQRALPEPDPEPELIDDPYIGVNGKVFRRRR
jgi:uncharacterized membrane protein YqaE (UPF0057 family)